MQRKKIFLTGASGLVGSYLVTQIKANCIKDIYVTIHNESFSTYGKSIQLDLSQTENVSQKLKEIKPDIIVNLAVFTNVDLCEIELDLATRLNRDLVAAISKYVYDNDKSYFLHVSTDYVFDGNEGNYTEDCQTNPINWYGITKLQGEDEIVHRLKEKNWCIARTSTPFGVHPKKKSFPIFLLTKLYKSENVKVMVDQYTSPTYAMNLAKMLKEIIDRGLKGIIHTSGASRLSRYEQALKIAQKFGLNEELILKVRSDEMGWKAKRPKDFIS